MVDLAAVKGGVVVANGAGGGLAGGVKVEGSSSGPVHLLATSSCWGVAKGGGGPRTPGTGRGWER